MAQNIVQGLFGPQPWELQQQQQQALQQQAMQYAQMAPLQRATAGMYQAGGQIGAIGAEAAGWETPQMRQAKQQQAIMAEGGMNLTPEGLRAKAKRFLDMGDQRTAFMLMQYAQQQEAEQQEMALKRAQELAQLKKAQSEASPLAKLSPKDYTPESWAEYVQTGDTSKLRAIDKPEAPPASYREWQLAGSPGTFAEWLATSQARKAPQITNVMPGTEKPIDVSKMRNEVMQSIRRPLDTLQFADTALATLDLSIQANNPSAFQSARVNLAKAAGDANISIREIEAAGGDPSLFGALTDRVSVWTTGTPSIDTQKKMKATIEAIREVASRKARSELDAQARMLHAAGYSAEQIDALLNMPNVGFEGVNSPYPAKPIAPSPQPSSAKKPNPADAALIQKYLVPGAK